MLLGEVESNDEVAPVDAVPLTCKRFLSVTNSVLKLFNLCCKCTASFELEASEILKHFSTILIIRLQFVRLYVRDLKCIDLFLSVIFF